MPGNHLWHQLLLTAILRAQHAAVGRLLLVRGAGLKRPLRGQVLLHLVQLLLLQVLHIRACRDSSLRLVVRIITVWVILHLRSSSEVTLMMILHHLLVVMRVLLLL